MPWSVSDVDSHKKGLTPEQKKKWVSVANGVLDDCIKKGGTDKTCAPKAIRIANSKFSEETPIMKNEQVPSNALCFVDHDARAEVFAEGETKIPKLRMTAYSGKIIPNHFWWGDLALDVAGMKLVKKRIPILEEHDTERKIAFTDKVLTEDNKVVIDPESSVFMNTPESKKFQELSQEGFPFESSVRMQPLKIQRLAEKESADVNGFTMKGPGTIIREWNLKEASVCVFGYDSNTNSKAFNEKVQLTYTDVSVVEDSNSNTKEVKTMTKEEFIKENPELYAEMQKDVKDSVTAELTTQFATEKKALQDELTAMKEEKKTLDNRMLELEKREEMRTLKDMQLEAERIWNAELSESKIPESLYSKLRKYVSIDSYIEKGILNVEKFTEAVKKEIAEWEGSGINKEVMGLGSGSRREEEGQSQTELAKENTKVADNLIVLAGGKVDKK